MDEEWQLTPKMINVLQLMLLNIVGVTSPTGSHDKSEVLAS